MGGWFPLLCQRGSPAFYAPFGNSELQNPLPLPPTPEDCSLSSPRAWRQLAGRRGHYLPASKHAERLLPASRWNLPPLRPLANSDAGARGIPGVARASPSWALSGRVLYAIALEGR
jgi:hypothetical protein